MARLMGLIVVMFLGLLAGCQDVRPSPIAPSEQIPAAEPLEERPPPGPDNPYRAGIIEPDTRIDHKIVITPPDPNTDYRMQIFPPAR